jgi:hypothetical protein
MERRVVLAMVKRRVRQAGLPDSVCCHTFRATGITTYLLNGGTLEKAQQIANHESPRTTKLYDRTNDELSLDEIEKILIWLRLLPLPPLVAGSRCRENVSPERVVCFSDYQSSVKRTGP